MNRHVLGRGTVRVQDEPWESPMFEEMKTYVGFGPEDEAALRALFPLVEPKLAWICGRFYDRILETPAARRVLAHERQVESLKKTLAQWLAELLTGPWDDDYHRRRRRIGVRHVEVGLPVRFMFAAMSGFAQDLEVVIADEVPPDQRDVTRVAVRRVTDLDLAIMTGTYVAGREERQLATLQDLIVAHMPVAMVMFDDRGRVTASTGAATRLLSGGSIVGRDWTEVLPASLIATADLEGLVKQAVAQDGPAALPRVDVRIAGEERSVRVTAVPLEHPDARVLLYLEDHSEARDLEARMQQTEALARLGSLSASVAHELRNPLAGMSAAIQVLQPSFDPSDRRGAVLGKIDEQVRRLNGLVTDLLAFARPGHAQLRDVDLAAVAESVVDLVQPDSGGVSVQVVGEGSAHADANLVHAILLNLVQNALNALDGSGRIRVRVDGSAVEVEDDGTGIPDDLHDRIFQPFFTTRTRGTGLGLAICQRSANLMGASLTLEDAGELGGARFRLGLEAALS